jgi:hypothetical protein
MGSDDKSVVNDILPMVDLPSRRAPALISCK